MVPVDKLSIVVTVIISRMMLHERLSRKMLLGLVLMVCGTLIMAVWS